MSSRCCQSPIAGESASGCAISKQRFFHGAAYHAAPSAPTLEISINQHNPSPCGSVCTGGYVPTPTPPSLNSSQCRSKSRPPESPPPPPPQQHYANPHYRLPNCGRRGPDWRQLGRNASLKADNLRRKLYHRRNACMFRVCIMEFILSALLLAAGVWCSRETHEFCPYYSAIWTSALFLLNASVGVAAAKKDSINLYIAHLVLSLISVVLCAVGAVLSARNWLLIGTYHHPKLSRDKAFCLLGEHDAPRISHIFSHMDTYDFRTCLFQLKIGIAMNSVQFLVTIILGLLFTVSFLLCLVRTCTRCSSSSTPSK